MTPIIDPSLDIVKLMLDRAMATAYKSSIFQGPQTGADGELQFFKTFWLSLKNAKLPKNKLHYFELVVSSERY
ncbi:MAG: hypothetical protein NTV34_19800 [Proteobacteria bacterium]|nr:hypothetical protein [Pseudomonadota bacterium]